MVGIPDQASGEMAAMEDSKCFPSRNSSIAKVQYSDVQQWNSDVDAMVMQRMVKFVLSCNGPVQFSKGVVKQSDSARSEGIAQTSYESEVKELYRSAEEWHG